MKRRTSVFVAALASVAALATGCGSGASSASNGTASASASPARTMASLQSCATQEGQLAVYTIFPDPIQQAVNAAFTAKYGVNVQSQRLVSNFAQRVTSEYNAGQHVTDVVIDTELLAFQQWAQSGWLVPAERELPSVPYQTRTTYNGKWADIQSNFQGIVYNTDAISSADAPRTWDDLLDPKYKGRILLLDPHGDTSSKLEYEALLKAKGADFLKKLGAQAQFVPSGSPGIQAVGAGSADIYAPAVPPLTATLKSSGLHIAAQYPSPNVSSDVLAGILKNSPHPCSAQLMLDFLMSKNGQQLLNKGGYSLLHDVSGTSSVPSFVKAGDVNATQADSDTIINLLTSGK